MPTRKNRRVLCFVDECGTAGENGFALGCVMVFAAEAGRADKAFSDLLERNANEIHASEWRIDVLKDLISRFAISRRRPENLLMLNRLAQEQAEEPAELYGRALVETVKTGLKMFRKRGGIEKIGNVHVIADANQHNTRGAFRKIVDEAMNRDGHFRAVEHVAAIDSAASRLLQLADIVAYARALSGRRNMSEAELKRLGIHLR